MIYEIAKKGASFPLIVMEKSKYLTNKCVFRNDELGVWLYQTDCLEFMDKLIEKYPEGKMDMIFADPPYFLSNGGISCHGGKVVKVDKGDWDKSQGVKLNHEFNQAWLSKCQKLLKPNGTIWVSGTHHVIHSIGHAMQQIDMKLLNSISWEKPNPPPNLSCRYFTHSTETIIWAAKDKNSKHIFNYEHMKQENNGKQMKTVWKIKPPQKWEKLFGKHPTQKPVQLIERIILASTKPQNLIFDPFSGSSTTGVAAIQQKRKFIACELEENFISISKKRLESTISNYKDSLELLEITK